jgi:hypothetical protein
MIRCRFGADKGAGKMAGQAHRAESEIHVSESGAGLSLMWTVASHPTMLSLKSQHRVNPESANPLSD